MHKLKPSKFEFHTLIPSKGQPLKNQKVQQFEDLNLATKTTLYLKLKISIFEKNKKCDTQRLRCVSNSEK